MSLLSMFGITKKPSKEQSVLHQSIKTSEANQEQIDTEHQKIILPQKSSVPHYAQTIPSEKMSYMNDMVRWIKIGYIASVKFLLFDRASYGYPSSEVVDKFNELDQYLKSAVLPWLQEMGIVKIGSDGYATDKTGFSFTRILSVTEENYDKIILPEIERIAMDGEDDILLAKMSDPSSVNHYVGLILTPDKAKTFFERVMLYKTCGLYPILLKQNDFESAILTGFNLNLFSYQIKHMASELKPGDIFEDIDYDNEKYKSNIQIYMECCKGQDDDEGYPVKPDRKVKIGLAYGRKPETNSVISVNASEEDFKYAAAKMLSTHTGKIGSVSRSYFLSQQAMHNEKHKEEELENEIN